MDGEELPVNIGVAVRRFQEAAGDSVDELNVRQYSRYTGMQCEELAEKLNRLGSTSSGAAFDLQQFAATLDTLGKLFKKGSLDQEVSRAMVHPDIRANLVDDDIDLSWVSFGSLNSVGADVFKCVSSVAHANLSKIGANGLVQRDDNGKIMKPDGWVEPDHMPNLYPVPVAAGEPITSDAKSRVSGFSELG